MRKILFIFCIPLLMIAVIARGNVPEKGGREASYPYIIKGIITDEYQFLGIALLYPTPYLCKEKQTLTNLLKILFNESKSCTCSSRCCVVLYCMQ